MTSKITILVVMISALALLASCGSSGIVQGVKRESLYDRVMHSGTIRCSYLACAPYCIKDPNSGELSGIFVEAMETVGRKLGLKVVWTGEVGYESLFEGLNSDRYDVFAGGLWPNASRAKAADFSIPIYYGAVKAYGRSDEKRFENNLDAINASDVRI